MKKIIYMVHEDFMIFYDKKKTCKLIESYEDTLHAFTFKNPNIVVKPWHSGICPIYYKISIKFYTITFETF